MSIHLTVAAVEAIHEAVLDVVVARLDRDAAMVRLRELVPAP